METFTDGFRIPEALQMQPPAPSCPALRPCPAPHVCPPHTHSKAALHAREHPCFLLAFLQVDPLASCAPLHRARSFPSIGTQAQCHLLQEAFLVPVEPAALHRLPSCRGISLGVRCFLLHYKLTGDGQGQAQALPQPQPWHTDWHMGTLAEVNV